LQCGVTAQGTGNFSARDVNSIIKAKKAGQTTSPAFLLLNGFYSKKLPSHQPESYNICTVISLKQLIQIQRLITFASYF
jgi:hypothetical protein